jgi:hypothetical protein
MASVTFDFGTLNESNFASIQSQIELTADDLLNSLPAPESLTAGQRRDLIARYTAVLEGNFIYWMTGAYLAARTDEARSIIIDNLTEEVRDSHPAMLRRFAIAAAALPNDTDTLAVHADLTRVRLYVGQLSAVGTLLMMGFFEGFIQKFMSYLADTAALRGSAEMEYTDVHGVCDIAHTEGLMRALAAEMALEPEPPQQLFEGVELLANLMETVFQPAVCAGA